METYQTFHRDCLDCREVMMNTATREINKGSAQKTDFFSSNHCPSVHKRSARLHVLLFSCLWILLHPRASSSLSDSSEVWTTAFERWGMNFRHEKGHRPPDYDCCGPALPHFVTAKTNSEAFSKRKKEQKTHTNQVLRGENRRRPVLLLHAFLKKS